MKLLYSRGNSNGWKGLIFPVLLITLFSITTLFRPLSPSPLFTSASPGAAVARYSPIQQQLYNTLSSIHTIDDLNTNEYQTVTYNLSNLSLDLFVLGFSHPSAVVKQVTLQTFSNILQYNSALPSHPNKEHPYTQQLESLSMYFITYHKKFPISYTPQTISTPPPWASDSTYNRRETELIGIIQPIVNIGSLEISSALRHIAIPTLKLVIQHYPGTTPTTIRLLQYLSGQDVFIGGTFYGGSQYNGVESFINQQFLSKVIRLHLSSVWTDDYETLRRASLAVLDLYSGQADHSNDSIEGLDSNDDDEDSSGGSRRRGVVLEGSTERHQTLAFDTNIYRPNSDVPPNQFHTTAVMGGFNSVEGGNGREKIQQRINTFHTLSSSSSSPSSNPRSSTTYSTLNFIDPDIDQILNDVHAIAGSSEDMSILYECSYGLSESKMTTDHLNTFYSLVISPDYNTSYYALIGIKRIALLSAIPGTIYITSQESSENDKKSTNTSQLQQSIQPHPTSKHVQAVSQAELTTMINPSHGQLAIKILKHSSSKHPNHYLQQFSSLAFDDVIAEVKAQLQQWYTITSSKGLTVYKEADNAVTNINDVKFKHKYQSLLSSFSKGRLYDKYHKWQEAQQMKHYMKGTDGVEHDVSSVQQILYMARRSGIKSLHKDEENAEKHKKYAKPVTFKGKKPSILLASGGATEVIPGEKAPSKATTTGGAINLKAEVSGKGKSDHSSGISNNHRDNNDHNEENHHSTIPSTPTVPPTPVPHSASHGAPMPAAAHSHQAPSGSVMTDSHRAQ